MDWGQQQPGVGFLAPRSELHAPRMQYQHGGSRSRSRMPPFARGGAYSRGPKQFQPPPPPTAAPLPVAALPPPPPLNKYDVLMEAGRLAAEYLVAKGVLPPGSLQQRGGAVGAGGWGQLLPPPPMPPGQEASAYYNARNGRRPVDDECGIRNARSRRNRDGNYGSSNSSYYNGRGKRKFGADNRYSDSGRDRGRNKGYSDTRSYDEDDEDGAPGFKQERQSSGETGEVGSSVSGVAGVGLSSKAGAMVRSKLEDTGSKAISNNNVRQKADVPQEVEDDNEANKLQEDNVVSNSEVVEQALNCKGNSNSDSSGVAQETETKHLPVSSGEKVSDGRPEDSDILSEKVEDDITLHEKAEDDTTSDEVSIVETDLPNDPINLLNYCSFARVPRRPRSVLANRNAGPAQREFTVPGQVNLVTSGEMSQTAMDGEANANSITSIQEDSKDEAVRQEHAGQSTTCDHVAELVTFHGKGTQGETEDMEEEKNIPQLYGIQDNKEPNELSPSFASHQNSFNLQVEKGIQIYNLDMRPQDEVLIDPPDKGKTIDSELLPSIKEEAAVTIEGEQLGQISTAGCSVELRDNQQVDFGTTLGNNSGNTETFLLGDKAVQVIDFEDDPPIEAGACDNSKAKGDMVYSSVENMMNLPTNTDTLHGIQDDYSLAISDYLGADMPCYQSIQTDLQAGMDLNGSEGIAAMDDPIYSSLGDIGFMEVWDPQPQDYEKFF
ncbi:unnamed protein product [Urochloa humidicola]